MAIRVTSSDQVYQERTASNLNKLRALLREALEVANATPVHDDGHPGGTYRHIKEALENIDGPGATDRWAEINEWPAAPETHTNQLGHELKTVIKYGRRGAGDKIHRLVAKEIVGLTDEARANTQPRTLTAAFLREEGRAHGSRRPIYFSVQASCNANGQHTATVVEGYGEEHVNCKSCERGR